MTPDVESQLTQLEQRLRLQTDGLAQMLQGRWTGRQSLEADLKLLNPTTQLTPKPPLLVSQAPAPPKGWRSTYQPNTEMPPQVYDWTCSACSLDWVLRATGVAPHHTREQAVSEIGYPENVNPTYGLMDSSGSALRRVFADYGLQTGQAWLTFDQVWAGANQSTGQMSGGTWYHWVAIRGTKGSDLWIANSAPGYKGVWDILTREQFAALGPFSVVYLV
ncbi:MAG: hypothetical protein JO020_14915 [Chloroflexi bacterium]|nr:hypothetical protein [Chloroflexota bacterium]MBV9131812.1 hypothetical protein [Chloroflexota bacterium]MBV9895452.1 hypothetical protein [Chloroflexota bacterium]